MAITLAALYSAASSTNPDSETSMVSLPTYKCINSAFGDAAGVTICSRLSA